MIGLGNALVDILVILENDNLLKEIELPKGSMQLITTEKFIELKNILSRMDTYQATGGSAANTILALASLQTPVGFIGKIGSDHFGTFFERSFKKKGIETKLLIDEQHNSGVASTFISPDGERTFGTFLGAAAELSAYDIHNDIYSGYDILYVEGYLVQNHDLILKAVKLAKELGVKVCIDLASYNIVAEDLEFFTYLVENYVDIVFANEEEAFAFSGLRDPKEALDYIAKRCSIAVVKVGANGSYVMCDGVCKHAKALNNRSVLDTTGAGDYFAAGFLYGYISGINLLKCAEIGSLLSGHVIEVVGTSLIDTAWSNILKKIDVIMHR